MEARSDADLVSCLGCLNSMRSRDAVGLVRLVDGDDLGDRLEDVDQQRRRVALDGGGRALKGALSLHCGQKFEAFVC